MKKILVVDDSPEILYVVDLILTHHRYDVKTSHRWSIIQKSIDTFAPDLILLDIDLDGADGGEICKSLKQTKENQEIPIILFSAHVMPEYYIEESEAQGFLSKPFETTHLLKVLQDNLN